MIVTTKFVESLSKRDPERAEKIARNMWEGAMRAETFAWNANGRYSPRRLRCQKVTIQWASLWCKINRTLRKFKAKQDRQIEQDLLEMEAEQKINQRYGLNVL